MFRKISCKFFPDCFDEDECLFEHDNVANEEVVSSVCPNGSVCSDQSCEYSEQNHRKPRQELCRFQVKCNRNGCQFMHNVARKAFLGEGLSGIRKM